MAHNVLRWCGALIEALVLFVARRAPEISKRLMRRMAERYLPPDYDIETHFVPPYNPWDQRLCLMVDCDLYKVISDGKVDMVTDRARHIDATGIVTSIRARPDRTHRLDDPQLLAEPRKIP